MTTEDPASNAKAPRRALLLAYHFPPLAGSSGLQRTLALARYLGTCGWQPLVLSAHPRAYRNTSNDLLASIPDDVPVVRAPAWDASRHFAIRGKYPGWIAWPDQWGSWLPGAVFAGRRLVQEYSVDLIFSTYPIPTAHLTAALIARSTGLPWVADFRDLMVDDDWPQQPLQRRANNWIERITARHAAACTFTTPGALRHYARRYPNWPRERGQVVSNGYDEAAFAGVNAAPPTPDLLSGPTLLHSGIVYPLDRNPSALFAALAEVNAVPGKPPVRLSFRAPRTDNMLADLAREHGVEAWVNSHPPLPYGDALREMCASDALLVLQGPSCDNQIPAKIYEYLRSDRPIVGVVGPHGDTAKALRQCGVTHLADINDPKDIRRCLNVMRDCWLIGQLKGHGSESHRYSREAGVRAFANLFDYLIDLSQHSRTTNRAGP